MVHDAGIRRSTRVLTAQRLDDPRGILSIGYVDAAVEDLGSIAERCSETKITVDPDINNQPATTKKASDQR